MALPDFVSRRPLGPPSSTSDASREYPIRGDSDIKVRPDLFPGRRRGAQGLDRALNFETKLGIAAGPRDEALDGWRGVACLLVYFVHKAVTLDRPPLVVPGFTGVHMFFVLSGYLLSGPFLTALLAGRDLPSSRRYLLRRFVRIYPPYLVSLAFYLAARVALGDKLPDATNLVTHLLLAFNYSRASYYYSINAVYWSLAIEAQFYVLLPIAAILARSVVRSKAGSAMALVVGMASIGVLARAAEVIGIGPRAGAEEVRFTTIFAHLDWFAAGMAVALVEARGASRGRPAVWLVLGVIVYLSGTNWHHFASGSPRGSAVDLALTIGFPTVVCAGLGMILGASRFAPESAWTPLRSRPLVWVGMISYSLFLYHIGVQVALQRLWPMRSIADPAWNNLAQALVALPPTILLSALMFAVVERPCLRAMAGWRSRTSPTLDRAGAP
jgi:peptidoglycan/LPS O-acetylase OafA/YrhL